MLPSQSELERLFDLSLDLFCIAGFDGYFRRVNLAFERTLGYSKEWLLSRPMLDTVHPDDLQSCYDALGDLANGNDLIGFENRVVCADGSVRWLQWNTRAVPEEGFVYGVARDVTDRRRADAELRKAHQMVEASHDELRVLAEEQAALRRVATLVAQGGPSDRLLEVVAEEVGRVVHVPLVSIVRYETDNAATEVGNFSERGRLFPVGARWSLDGQSVVARVRERGWPARIDDHSGLEGEIAELVQRLGIRSTVGIPICVRGHLWGAMVVSSSEPEPLPESTEMRLERFTELVATAFANAESRAAQERLADEQAALRRVATLVARRAAPRHVFATAAAEVGRLLGADSSALARYEADGTVTVVAADSHSDVEIPIGMRISVDGENAIGAVLHTGQASRRDASKRPQAQSPSWPET